MESACSEHTHFRSENGEREKGEAAKTFDPGGLAEGLYSLPPGIGVSITKPYGLSDLEFTD
ncbi:MAG: hypothetical protein ACERK6_14290, partial [Candidatus Aminicenantaceae bacterium]